MVRADTAIPFARGSAAQVPGCDDTLIGRRIEDWIVSTLGDRAAPPSGNEWLDRLGPAAPTRRGRRGTRGSGTTRGGWARFRLARRRVVTVVALTDQSLLKWHHLDELAGDLRALVEAGHHRVVLDFGGVERLTSCAVGAVADLHRRCAAGRGGALKVCGLSAPLATLFAITGLDREIALFRDEAAALASPWPEGPALRPLPVAVLSGMTRSAVGARPLPLPGRAETPTPVEDHSPMSEAWLIPQVGPSKGRPVGVAGPRFVIGRDPSCQMRPAALSVSRAHAAIEHRGDRLFLRDLGSTHGTLLNGRRLQGEEAELRDGDSIRIGPLSFTLKVGPGRERTATAEWDRPGASPVGRLSNGDEPATEDYPTLGLLSPKYEVVEGVVVVTPREADLDDEATIGPLRALLLDLLERPLPPRVVVNLRYVGHLSGRAIGALVAHHLTLDRAGGALRVCEAHARVAAVLDQVHLAQLVGWYPAVDDAVLSAWPGTPDSVGRPAI